MEKNIQPVGNRLLVRQTVVEQYRSGSLVVPHTVGQWIPPTQGEVLSVGPRVTGVGVGDTVVYGLEAGAELEDGLRIISEVEVVCRIE